jgi:hypothetical protein
MAATPFLLLLAADATGHTVDARECRIQLTMPADPKHVVDTHEIEGRKSTTIVTRASPGPRSSG